MQINTFICGDAYKTLKTFDSDTASLIITSPPYHLKRKYFAGEEEIGKEKTFEEYIDNLVKVFKECQRVIMESGNIFIVVGDYYDRKTHSLVGIPEFLHCKLTTELGLIRRHRIVWRKPNGKINGSIIYKRIHNNLEIILHYTKTSDISKMYFKVPMVKAAESTIQQYNKFYKGQAQKDYETYGAMNPSDMKRNIIKRKFAPFGGNKYPNNPSVNNSMYSGNEYIPNEYSIDESVWSIPHPTRNTLPHTAMFPEELTDKIIQAACPPKGLVIDPFCGVGTACFSALKLGRIFIGIDLQKDYINIANKKLLTIS